MRIWLKIKLITQDVAAQVLEKRTKDTKNWCTIETLTVLLEKKKQKKKTKKKHMEQDGIQRAP